MATTAVVLYLVFMAIAFGLRSYQHWRRTGSIGFHGVRGGARERLAGALFAAAVVLGLAAPSTQALGLLDPITALDTTALHVAGLVLALAGIATVVLSQSAMGDSWRIGVDPAETTTLITRGLFATIRNPIFSAMALAYLGLALMAPNLLAFVGLIALIVAVQLQVRLVEEPHLHRTHGPTYEHYTAHAGRFIPGIGRIPPDRWR
ncbi:methyltransferase family protein [Actinokineospora sp. NPDC004072]